MVNCRREFLEHVKDKKVKCAIIYSFMYGKVGDVREYCLKLYFSDDDYENFLDSIDFIYDNEKSLGSPQIIYGTIWYEDGMWSSRHEMEGSEWWSLIETPIIPESLNNELGQRKYKIHKIKNG